MNNGYHLSLSLSRELWNELLRTALPLSLVDGEFDLVRQARQMLKQLEVRRRVAGLLEDRQPPEVLVRAGDRARKLWQSRRAGFYQRLGQIVQVRGTWKVELDDLGTDLTYSRQKVNAQACVKGVASGTLVLLAENVEIPFTIEKRLAASVALGEIRYDRGREAVIGDVQDLGVHLGDRLVLQLFERLLEMGLEQRLGDVNPVQILSRQQVSEMVSPMGGPLKMQMGVDDLRLDIDEDDLTLRVRFGFSQAQLTDRGA